MEKIKKIFFTKQLLVLAIVILIGFFLRLIALDKADGLWFDEAVSYYIAKDSFPLGIIKHLLDSDLQPPLYYMLLHFWIQIFGSDDITLRFLSVILGILTIPVMFFAGKELHSKNTGIIAAIFTCINSLLIYYSQEVRFYSLIVFLVSLSILFLIRYKNNSNKINLLGLVISNLVLLYTASLGFIFVFLECFIYFIYLYLSKKSDLKQFIYAQLFTLFVSLPCFTILIYNNIRLSKNFINLFDWARFTYSCIIYTFQDWFTPVLINIINNPHGYYEKVFSWGLSPFFVLFVIIPVLIYLTGIIITIYKRNFASLLLLIGILFFITEIILASNGKITFISRYTIFSLPLIIISAGYGLVSIKNKQLFISLISLFILVNIFFLILSPFSAQRLVRPETFKSVATILKAHHLDQENLIIMPYGGKYLSKYYADGANVVDFDLCDTYQLNKKRALERIFEQDLIKSITRKNAYDKLKDYISSINPVQPLESYMQQEIINKLPENKYLIIVISRGIAIYDEKFLQIIPKQDEFYKKQSLFFMLSSKTILDMLKISNKHLTPVNTIKRGIWEIYIFKK